jgi:hypothetical protein
MDLSSSEMKEIADAVAMLHRGDKPAARARLLALWDEHAAKGRLQMCVAAHFLADTEATPTDELEWDLRALEAATGSREAEDREPLSPDLASFLPSLHGSVGNGYRRLGDQERARLHVGFATARIDALADDAYGQQVRGVLRRLQVALGLSPLIPV